ncbi:MAG TPA: hypothetical protein VMV49_03670 [Candidatus Deferrimicrobium sp.]|nr:hypothetical protein [Candidatus Deferrimicrobium sp.]
MASMGIKFVPLPVPLQERVNRVMKKIEKGEIDSDWGSQLFLKYFAQRISIIAENSPHREELELAAKGKRLALIIKGTDIDHAATFGDSLAELTIERPSKLGDPAMIFNNMDVFLDVILSRKDLMRAGIEKQVEVRKMVQLFKWMAPILALQDEKTQQQLEARCPVILSGIIDVIEEKYGLK